MDIDEFRHYCLSLPDTTEELPFGPDALVMKIKGKMFALASLESFASINLKCDPEEAVELRERYNAVLPGYHMNKKHWNTIIVDGTLGSKQLKECIDNSYMLVKGKKK